MRALLRFVPLVLLCVATAAAGDDVSGITMQVLDDASQIAAIEREVERQAARVQRNQREQGRQRRAAAGSPTGRNNGSQIARTQERRFLGDRERSEFVGVSRDEEREGEIETYDVPEDLRP